MPALIERADKDKMRRAMETSDGGASDRSQSRNLKRQRRPIQRRADDGGVGTEGILEGMAEPDAGVDVDGDSCCRCVFFAGMLTLEYERSWTAAERLYLSDYLKSGARGKASATATGKYTLLEAVVGKGQQRLVMGDEIEPVPELDGRPGYRLTDEGVKDGITRLTWVTGVVQRPWSAPGDERGGVRGS